MCSMVLAQQSTSEKKKREKGAEEGTILDSLAQSRNMVKEKLAPQEMYQLRRLLI